jgi:hypothetical protein
MALNALALIYRRSAQHAELDDSDDPSNITIYLATYIGGKLANNLYALTWPTSSGSVYITMTETAPHGYVVDHLRDRFILVFQLTCSSETHGHGCSMIRASLSAWAATR